MLATWQVHRALRGLVAEFPVAFVFVFTSFEVFTDSTSHSDVDRFGSAFWEALPFVDTPVGRQVRFLFGVFSVEVY